jgi:Spy/CpxP family protein refolding chaperone
MTKRSILSTTTAASLAGVLLLAGPALASPWGPCGGGEGHHGGPPVSSPLGREHGAGRLIWQLDLTKAQREQVRAVLDEGREKSYLYRTSLREGRATLRNAMRADDSDMAEVRKLAEAQGRALADLIVLRAETRDRIRAVLTPEQRTRLEALQSGRTGRGDL